MFDGSLQGIAIKDKPGVRLPGPSGGQPGPHDVLPLFERFIDDMEAVKREATAGVGGILNFKSNSYIRYIKLFLLRNTHPHTRAGAHA